MKLGMEGTVAVPPALVFDLMADVRNETEWNSRVSRAELVSAEPIGLGSRFLTVNRGYEYGATITAYERPSRLVFEVDGKPMAITASFDFRPSGGGTEFQAAFEVRPRGAMKIMLPLLKPMVRRDQEKQRRSFAAFCESKR